MDKITLSFYLLTHLTDERKKNLRLLKFECYFQLSEVIRYQESVTSDIKTRENAKESSDFKHKSLVKITFTAIAIILITFSLF